MDNKINLIAQSLGSDKVKLDEPLAQHMATGLGGPAKLFFVATHTSEILRIVKMAGELKIPVLIFGSGSKMAISDNGFDGVVIKNRTGKLAVIGVKGKVSKLGLGVDEVLVTVDSGVTISNFLEFLENQGLDPMQVGNSSGTIGGNLFSNRSLLELAQKVRILEDGEINEIDPFNLRLQRHIILSAIFKFKTKRG